MLRHSHVRTSARNVFSESAIHCVWTGRVTETAKRRDIYLQVFLASLLVRGKRITPHYRVEIWGASPSRQFRGAWCTVATHFPHAAGGSMSAPQHDCSTAFRSGIECFHIMLILSVRVMRMVALCTPTPPLPHYTFDPLVTQHHDDSGRRPYSDRRIGL